jgi:8-amino-7-oxononanoate synthase
MQHLPDGAQKKLQERREEGSFRSLRHFEGLIDLCSNDYLGFAIHPFIIKAAQDALTTFGRIGSGGSRLLTGNHPLFNRVEEQVAAFHQGESALFFSSGYEANSGLIAAISRKGDIILYDSLCHASIREGIRLSVATSYSFNHNDLNDLREKLIKYDKNVYVITESVFSMDGDICPLEEMMLLCEKYGARLIIDEAHATGVIGPKGAGLVQQCGVQDAVFARIHTFGKGIGASGAVIIGSKEMRDYLINFCRSFIYTTAPNLAAVAAVQAAYDLLSKGSPELQQLKSIMQQVDGISSGMEIRGTGSAIRTIVIPGNEQVRRVANQIQEAGYLVLPVLAPTVPEGSERLRICLHAYNTLEEVQSVIGIIERTLA